MEVSVGMVGKEGGEPRKVLAGADTWASRNLIHVDLFNRLGGRVPGLPRGVPLMAVGGHKIESLGVGKVEVNGKGIEVYVLPKMGLKTQLLLGDPALRELSKGQLCIDYRKEKAEAYIGSVETDIVDSDCIIKKQNLGEGKSAWSYEWIWKDKYPPATQLKGRSIYRKKGIDEKHVDTGIQQLIADGVLERCHNPKLLIPINPVCQRIKKPEDPVRITGDFSASFNRFICSDSTIESNEICSEAIRRMRAFQAGTVLDLKAAYLSVLLAEHLRDYQCFHVNDVWYRATRLMFGVSIGQKILFLILQRLLKNRYIGFRDDLFLPSGVSVKEVVETLESNSFTVKKGSWRLEDIAEGDSDKSILGLRVTRLGGELRWMRKPIQDIEVRTARDLATMLGEAAASHLPCLGPVRAEVSLLRSVLGRWIGSDMTRWDADIPDDIALCWGKTHASLKQEESRSYQWKIPDSGTYRLYCDASNILLGGMMRIKNDGVESGDIFDFSVLNKNQVHINVAELEAALTGINILTEYAPREADVEIFVDSKTCRAWLKIALEHGIVRTNSMYRALIKTRLEVFRQTVEMMRWKVSVTWLDTLSNPADVLTRPRQLLIELWRSYNKEIVIGIDDVAEEPSEIIGALSANGKSIIKSLHESRYHPGASVMRQLLRSHSIDNMEEKLGEVIRECEICQRKRPAPKYINQKREVDANQPWRWLQIDTLSLERAKVIALIDEYSRFVEVKIIPGAPNAELVIELLTQWYGRYSKLIPTPWHLRADRGTEFNNRVVADWVVAHGGTMHYSTSRRPTGCAIIERWNRTILSLIRTIRAMKTHLNERELVESALAEYWVRPHSGLSWLSPSECLHGARPGVESTEEEDDEYPSDSERESFIETEPRPGLEDPGGEPQPTAETDVSATPAEPADVAEVSSDTSFQSLPEPSVAVGDAVLIHIPTKSKLDLPWSRAKVIRADPTAITVVQQPGGKREVRLNRQITARLISDQEAVIPERPARNRHPPERLNL